MKIYIRKDPKYIHLGEKKLSVYRIGAIQKKILILLFAGVALGCTRNPIKAWKIIGIVPRAFKEINEKSLKQSLRSLYSIGLVETQKNKNGEHNVVLTKSGKEQALRYNIDEMKIEKPKKWDGSWWVVLFDVPEKIRLVREMIREHLRALEFYELQKSVFIHPYPCAKQIESIAAYYDAGKFVRLLRVIEIDNEYYYKREFGLN